ncbi:MAG: hypothetical protein ACRCXD_10360, partial [Luteolibacter sp.]
MPDSTTPPADPSTSAPAARGYYQKAQLEDLALAESILTAARDNAADLDEQDISALYLDGFDTVVKESRKRATESGQAKEGSKAATDLTSKAATDLVTGLQKVQSSAKQKHKMLDEDGDPATNFPTDGYLIGTRLNASRAVLLQSADTLILRAKADSLPGFKTAAKIKVVEDLLAEYRGKSGDQQEVLKEKEIARLDRDELLHILNTRRASIQHAADAV